MGLFARFWRKKPVDLVDIGATRAPEPVLLFCVESAIVISDPLSGAAGTSLPEELIYSVLHSLTTAISAELRAELRDELRDGLRLAKEFEAIAAYAANAPQTSIDFLVSDLSFNPEFGHAARLSAPGKKLTVLLGSPAPVARASAPFAPEIQSYLLQTPPENQRQHVLVIDGISYAAITTKSQK